MLRKIWIEVRSSLWFVPGLLVLGSIALALGLVELDIVYANVLGAKRWQPLLNTGAEGARGVLTSIASSMITVAGVAFSITIVTLSLASTQYTPRILRNFMRDRSNQFVLGIFVAIFTYCLVVLRTIRGGAEQEGGFVPLLAVAFGLVLALLSVGCLIFFIHHVAASIQASSILQAITRETMAAMDSLFPGQLEHDEQPAPVREMLPASWHPVVSHANGYIQHVNTEGLNRFAREQKAGLKTKCSTGEFVAQDAPLLFADRHLDDDEVEELRLFFVIGDFRTVEQDIGFGIRQIVDIALKALSPGVNDTSTAVSCLHYLSALLCQLGRRRLAPLFSKEDDAPRVFAPRREFADYAAMSFDEIRLSASGNVTILLELLRAIERVGLAIGNPARRARLLQHAGHVVELADRSVPATCDRERINAQIESLRSSFGADAGTPPSIPPQRAASPWR